MTLARTLAITLALCIGAGALEAQIIRGTVEDTTRMPLNDVLVSLLGATGDSVLRSTRTGNAGEFTLTIPRTGRYRVRVNRIGYMQQTTGIMDVKQAEIITLRFTMEVTAQTLGRVEVVERRPVSRDELMSASGFDVRSNRYPMNTMDAEQLAAEGGTSLETLFYMGFFRGLEVVTDSQGTSLRMRGSDTGGPRGGYCTPEVHLDGILLSDGAASTAEAALLMLTSISADQAHGVEVYRGNEIPPPSIGGLLGASGITARPCGVVAVWTKLGRERSLILERARAEGSMQVVRGQVVDFATGHPIPGVRLTLRSEYGADLEPAVVSDSTGHFSIQTKHFERIRIAADAGTHVSLVTPAFPIDLEELLTIEVILARDREPRAPVALLRRELARNFKATDIAGFGFRMRRGLDGFFFDSTQIARSGATSLGQLLEGIPDVLTGLGAAAGSGGREAPAGIMFRTAPPAPTTEVSASGRVRTVQTEPPAALPPCAPMYFLNGELQRDAGGTVFSTPLREVYGVEVFPLANKVPHVYRMGSTGCGIVGVWVR